MRKKIYSIFALAAMLLALLPRSVSAASCTTHSYVQESQEGCTTVYICTVCQWRHWETNHTETVTQTPCVTTYLCETCGQQTRLPEKYHIFLRESFTCEEYPLCETCGEADDYVLAHAYSRSLFRGFTYCIHCHDWTFSFWAVDWLTLISFLIGLAFMITILVLTLKARDKD